MGWVDEALYQSHRQDGLIRGLEWERWVAWGDCGRDDDGTVQSSGDGPRYHLMEGFGKLLVHGLSSRYKTTSKHNTFSTVPPGRWNTSQAANLTPFKPTSPPHLHRTAAQDSHSVSYFTTRKECEVLRTPHPKLRTNTPDTHATFKRHGLAQTNAHRQLACKTSVNKTS